MFHFVGIISFRLVVVLGPQDMTWELKVLQFLLLVTILVVCILYCHLIRLCSLIWSLGYTEIYIIVSSNSTSLSSLIYWIIIDSQAKQKVQQRSMHSARYSNRSTGYLSHACCLWYNRFYSHPNDYFFWKLPVSSESRCSSCLFYRKPRHPSVVSRSIMTQPLSTVNFCSVNTDDLQHLFLCWLK